MIEFTLSVVMTQTVREQLACLTTMLNMIDVKSKLMMYKNYVDNDILYRCKVHADDDADTKSMLMKIQTKSMLMILQAQIHANDDTDKTTTTKNMFAAAQF